MLYSILRSRCVCVPGWLRARASAAWTCSLASTSAAAQSFASSESVLGTHVQHPHQQQVETAQSQAELDCIENQTRSGLFHYAPLRKLRAAVVGDPVGLAKDVTKVVVGGFTAKTGATICATTGVGCIAGAGMLMFGLSDMAEGAGALYNRYRCVDVRGPNPLRWGLTELSPNWGDTAYGALNFGTSALALRARVPLKIGVADGLNRPGSIFGVSVPRSHNAMLGPLTNRPLPAAVGKGWLWLGVGAKGTEVINDLRQIGDVK